MQLGHDWDFTGVYSFGHCVVDSDAAGLCTPCTHCGVCSCQGLLLAGDVWHVHECRLFMPWVVFESVRLQERGQFERPCTCGASYGEVLSTSVLLSIATAGNKVALMVQVPERVTSAQPPLVHPIAR